jgi:CRP-like cAMP-binding protein
MMTAEDLKTKMSLLGALPLFARVTKDDLERLATSAQPVAFHPGERLCVAGAEPAEAYVVSEGEAAVTVGNVTVAIVGPTDVVGERGPITGRPRAATVTARSHLLAYGIPREEIADLIRRSPEAAAAMRDELLRRYG